MSKIETVIPTPLAIPFPLRGLDRLWGADPDTDPDTDPDPEPEAPTQRGVF